MSLLRAHKSVFEVVRDALAADSTLSHIKVSVGARFQGEQNPEVIIQQSSFDINDLNTADYGSFEISIFCYSNTYTEAAKIADTVFNAIQANDLYTLTEQELIAGSDPEQYNISQTLYHLKGLDLFLEHYDEDGYEANVLVRATEAEATTTGVGDYIEKTSGSPAPFYAQVDSRIQDLSDVNVSTLREGEILKYDVSEGEWVNAPLPLLASNGINSSEVNGVTLLSLADSPSFTSASTSGDLTVGGDLYFAGAQTKLIRPLNTGQAAGPLTIQSNGDLVIELDENDDETDKALIVKNGADTEVFKVDESGEVRVNSAYSLPTSDGLAGQSLVTNGLGVLSFADVSVDVQYHNRYATEAETLRAGATATVELYYTAQADGDGLHEDAQSDTATTGYDIRRKLYYAEKAQADPNTSGDWTQFADIADDTTYASAKATLLAYLKARTGGTVPISLKMTWEEVAEAPSFTGLLNESYGSGAAAAYSVRRLNGNYTGAAIQVERSSDNTTQDIGFDSNGDLDESALATFCSGTVCKVRTWYGQEASGGTGSGNDAQQTDHTKQPTIYTGGAIVKENGRVAVDFDGADDWIDVATNQLGSTELFADSGDAFSVFQYSNIDGDSTVFSKALATGSLRDYQLFYATNAWGYNVRGTINNFTDLEHENRMLSTFNWSGSSASSFFNGVSKNITVGTAAKSTQDINIGSRSDGGFPMNGTIQEILVYDSDKSTDRTSIESNIGDYFTQNTPLLDTYTGAAAAYSLRKLRSAFSGSAIRVRRASDNTEQDIGFNVFGELDTVSLASFCSGTNGFVKTWYDQSGNANDATQTATGSQPKIYDSSTGVVTENGKPALDVASGNNFQTAALSLNAYFSTSFVLNPDVAGGFILEHSNNSNNSDGFYLHGDVGETFNLRRTVRDRYNSTSGWIGTNQTLITLNSDGTPTLHKDGAGLSLTPVAVAGVSNTSTSQILNIFSRGGSSLFYDGKAQEVVVFNSDKSTDRTNIESNINTFYSIY